MLPARPLLLDMCIYVYAYEYVYVYVYVYVSLNSLSVRVSPWSPVVSRSWVSMAPTLGSLWVSMGLSLSMAPALGSLWLLCHPNAV